MNTKIKTTIMLLGIVTMLSLPYVVAKAQQANDYRVYTGLLAIQESTGIGTNYSGGTQAQFVPVIGGASYTYSMKWVPLIIDVEKPNTIPQQVASQVKTFGSTLGYNVVAVYEVNYQKVVPP